MPKCFGALFFRGFIFWQNAKGGGGKVIAKRFGALLKIFFTVEFPSRRGVLGVPKSL